MAWNVTETIGSDEDWTTLAAFEGDHDGDTPTDGTDCIGQVKGVPADSGISYWTGWQSGMDADTRIILEAKSGSETDGKTDATGDLASIQDRLYMSETTNVLWVIIRDIEFTASGRGIEWTADASGNTLYVIRCMFRDMSYSGITIDVSSGTSTINIGGCLGKDLDTNYRAFMNCPDADSTVAVVNCTVANSQHGLFQVAGTVSAKNVAVTNSDSSDFQGTISETTTKSEEDGDITNNDADDFTEPSTDDYTVYDTDSNLYHTGTAEAGSWFTSLCSVDFAGTSWASPPSVGCFEFPEAAGARRIIMSSTSWRLFAFMPFLVGVIKNPFLKRRDFFNPKNWMKK